MSKLWNNYVHHVKKLTTFVQPEYFDYSINISLKYGYMYVETPKVACSTIKTTLQRLELEDSQFYRSNHEDIHARNFSPLIKPSQVGNLETFLLRDDIYKFCFVRNPYTRLLSGYLDKIAGNRPPKIQILMLLGYNPADVEKEISFSEFVNIVISQPIQQMNPHWKIQYYQSFHNSIKYDFVGRLENLNRDLEKVFSKIGGNYKKYSVVEQRHKTDSNSKLAEYYSSGLADLVYTKYCIDFDRFGYSREIPTQL